MGCLLQANQNLHQICGTLPYWGIAWGRDESNNTEYKVSRGMEGETDEGQRKGTGGRGLWGKGFSGPEGDGGRQGSVCDCRCPDAGTDAGWRA